MDIVTSIQYLDKVIESLDILLSVKSLEGIEQVISRVLGVTLYQKEAQHLIKIFLLP